MVNRGWPEHSRTAATACVAGRPSISSGCCRRRRCSQSATADSTFHALNGGGTPERFALALTRLPMPPQQRASSTQSLPTLTFAVERKPGQAASAGDRRGVDDCTAEDLTQLTLSSNIVPEVLTSSNRFLFGPVLLNDQHPATTQLGVVRQIVRHRVSTTRGPIHCRRVGRRRRRLQTEQCHRCRESHEQCPQHSPPQHRTPARDCSLKQTPARCSDATSNCCRKTVLALCQARDKTSQRNQIPPVRPPRALTTIDRFPQGRLFSAFFGRPTVCQSSMSTPGRAAGYLSSLLADQWA